MNTDQSITAAAEDTFISPEANKHLATRKAIEMISQKYKDDEIVSALSAIGISESEGPFYISQARNLIVTEQKKQALRGMGVGALWLVGGLVITVGGYMMAGDGGHYMITWGAVVFGGFRIVTNLIAYLNAKV